jgi:hypothetical protein
MMLVGFPVKFEGSDTAGAALSAALVWGIMEGGVIWVWWGMGVSGCTCPSAAFRASCIYVCGFMWVCGVCGPPVSWRSRRRWGPRGIGSGCEINSAREEGRRSWECILHKTSARLLPLESPARGCAGSKYLCVPGPAVQGKSSHAPSPARLSLILIKKLNFSELFRGFSHTLGSPLPYTTLAPVSTKSVSQGSRWSRGRHG